MKTINRFTLFGFLALSALVLMGAVAFTKPGCVGMVCSSGAVPTISSGFGTSPSVTAGFNFAFRVNVGTGGVATTGVVALPTAPTGWNCFATDITTNATFVTEQTASTAATASFANYSRTTGLAIAWAASDVLAIGCWPY